MKIPLLQNDQALCWFDSGNFALFHKRRPELDTFFETDTDSDAIKRIKKEFLQPLYDHYSGKQLTNLKELITKFREDNDVKNIFKKTIQIPYTAKETFECRPTQRAREIDDIFEVIPETITFQIPFEKGKAYNIKQTKEGNAFEYITDRLDDTGTYLERIENKEKGFLYKCIFSQEEVEQKFNLPTQSKDNFDISRNDGNDVDEYIDIFISILDIFNTAKLRISDEMPLLQSASKYTITNPLEYDLNFFSKTNFITNNTNTIFVDTGYKKGDEKELQYPEYLTIPSYEPTLESLEETLHASKQQQTFQVDSIVVHTGGYHYFSYVRCGNTDQWVKYNDVGHTTGKTLEEIGIPKETLFSGFPASSKDEDRINQRAKLLIYSRIETPLTLIFDIDATLLPAKGVVPVNPNLLEIIEQALKQKEKKRMNIQLVLYTNNDSKRAEVCTAAVKEALKRNEFMFDATLTGDRSIKEDGEDPIKTMKDLLTNTETASLGLREKDVANIFFFDNNNKHGVKGGLGYDLGKNFIHITPAYDGSSVDTTDYSRIKRVLHMM